MRAARLRASFTLAIYMLAALPLLAAAQWLVWFVPFARWRGTLGLPSPVQVPSMVQKADHDAIWDAIGPVSPRLCARTRHIADAVARADRVLPVRTKCLARAVATQWIARLRGCPSVLTIAVHADRHHTPEPFHAWVSIAGDMVIGVCDPADYRAIIAFAQRDGGARPGAAGG